VPPGAASLVSRPVTPPVDYHLEPGNRIDVLPAAFGRLLVRFTVTVSPSLTINVGPGTCIVGHVARFDGRRRKPRGCAIAAITPGINRLSVRLADGRRLRVR